MPCPDSKSSKILATGASSSLPKSVLQFTQSGTTSAFGLIRFFEVKRTLVRWVPVLFMSHCGQKCSLLILGSMASQAALIFLNFLGITIRPNANAQRRRNGGSLFGVRKNKRDHRLPPYFSISLSASRT